MAEYFDSVLIEAYISSAWTDISSDVVSDILGEIGLYNSDYLNRLASSGSLRFDLNNVSGSYTPSSTFKKGTKVRVTVSYGANTRRSFFGYINEATIDTGTWGNQRVHVTVLDWLDYASNQPLRIVPASANATIDTAVTSLLNYSSVPPENIDLDAGANTFTTVFDLIDDGSTIYSELNNLALSELSYVYLTEGGETLRVENSTARNGLRTLVTHPYSFASSSIEWLKLENGNYLKQEDGVTKLQLNLRDNYTYTPTFDRLFTDLNVVNGRAITNEVKFTVYPRRQDSNTLVIFNYSNVTVNAIKIPANQTYTLIGDYVDPTGGGQQISATSVVTPTTPTDYTFNSKYDGTGTNLSANLSIMFTAGATGFKAVITNNGAQGWINLFNVRGKPVYRYSPINNVVDDTTSQNLYGLYQTTIRQPYKDEPSAAIAESDKILYNESKPRNQVLSAKFLANSNQTNMNGFMFTDIGDLIRIENTKPALDSYFYVQGLRFTITRGGIVNYELILKDTYSLYSGLTELGIELAGKTTSTQAVNFGLVPQVTDLLSRSVSMWIYPDTDVPDGTYYGLYGMGANFLFMTKANKKLQLYTATTGGGGNYGIWLSPTNSLTTGAWNHVVVTFNKSSVANDPIFYVNGSSVATTESQTPTGTFLSEVGHELIIGNARYDGNEYLSSFDGQIKYVKVYNRILTSTEVSTLYNSPTDYTLVTNGLVFQAFTVKTENYSTYLNLPLATTMKVLDNVNGYVGTPINNPTGRAI